MSNILIGVIGVILFIGLAPAGFLFFGDKFSQSSNDSKAVSIIAEATQIEQGVEMALAMTGKIPDFTNRDDILPGLVSSGYLKNTPPGAETEWIIDETGVVRSIIGSTDGARQICVTMRTKVGMPDPENPKACDASDITDNDPCCVEPT